MNQLTAFERALLAQFETLVSTSETSLEASEGRVANVVEIAEQRAPGM